MRPSFTIAIVALGLVLLPAAAQSGSSLPDVVGIRPGISAQEAYDALKAHAKGSKVGIGQMMLPSSDKPIVVVMSERSMNASPGEIITVWLTIPPSPQVVWAVSRQLTFEPGKEVLKADILDSLRQKYGPEMDPNYHAWSFTEQGSLAPVAMARSNNCPHVGQYNVLPPDDPTAPVGSTPLIYAPTPETLCTSTITVHADVNSPALNTLANSVTVTIQDTPLARRSQVAYQASLNSADAARQSQELNRAHQQKKPSF